MSCITERFTARSCQLFSKNLWRGCGPTPAAGQDRLARGKSPGRATGVGGGMRAHFGGVLPDAVHRQRQSHERAVVGDVGEPNPVRVSAQAHAARDTESGNSVRRDAGPTMGFERSEICFLSSCEGLRLLAKRTAVARQSQEAPAGELTSSGVAQSGLGKTVKSRRRGGGHGRRVVRPSRREDPVGW